MFYDSFKLLFSLNQICNLSSLHFSSAVKMTRKHVYTFNAYSPKGYQAGSVISTVFIFLLVQPITYTVSSCLATGSSHRFNSRNGMSRSHAAHKWLSQSHQLTLTLTLTYQLCEERITTDVIAIYLLCVFFLFLHHVIRK